MAKGKIGIIGRGNVGTALENGLQRAGYEVKIVGKDPPRVKEIGQWADMLVLAVPYAERENAMRELGDPQGKVLVDVTNAVGENNQFAHDARTSGAEQLQQKAGNAKVVKAFNTVFAQNMANGGINGDKLSLFVAGDDANAKKRVLEIGKDLGFDPVDSGPLQNARWLETLGYLNIQLGYGQNMGPNIGFKLIH